nr:hypothetical protein [Haladaptatus cibarius]
MQAVVLAAGKGMCLRPLTDEKPKAESIQRLVDEKTMLAMTADGWSVNVNMPEERGLAERRLKNST